MAKLQQIPSFMFVLIVILHVLSHESCQGRKVNKVIIKTIEAKDGEIIDCYDMYKQPAFKHPLLRNHVIQMKPSSYPDGFTMEDFQSEVKQTWHQHGRCPEGTVPIRRTALYNNGQKPQRINSTFSQLESSSPTKGHEYATAAVRGKAYYGGVAYINIWRPNVGESSEESISQIWITAGEGNSLNSVEAGWIVNPLHYGDYRARFFLYWTSDNYNKTGCYDVAGCSGFVQRTNQLSLGFPMEPSSTYNGIQYEAHIQIWRIDNYANTGCYNVLCPGFVQRDNRLSLGFPLEPLSTYNGLQYEAQIQIWKDKVTGNWWVKYGSVVIGYWPNSIFTSLSTAADRVIWGGEIVNKQSNGRHTTTQMGSGRFPSEGPTKASYFKNIQTVDATNTLRDPIDIAKYVITNPKCYDLALGTPTNTNAGYYFYYGGPGLSAICP